MFDLGFTPLDTRNGISIIGYSGEIKIQSAVVIDYNTHEILFEKNS